MKGDLVIVLTTQWRSDAVGGTPGAWCETPALEPLRQVSTQYLQAITPHPFGPFARAAILTGIPSPENGVREYHDPLPKTVPTWAHRWEALGYQTAFVGKWHLSRRERGVPLVGEVQARQAVPEENRGGFAFWEGFEGGFQLNDPWLQGGVIGAPTAFAGYQAEVVVDRALRWWREAPRDRPRAMVVSWEPPHPPYGARVPEGTPEVAWHLPPGVPLGGAIEAKARSELAGYVRQVQATAQALARLWQGLGAETTFAWTSVHGDMHGVQGMFRKGWPHEGALRVPLWVHAPQQCENRQESGPLSLLDLCAGVTDLAEGRTPQWTKERLRASMPSVVQLPWQCPYVWSAWRTAEGKVVRNGAGEILAIYDLQRDPTEERNLHGSGEGEALRRRVEPG